MSALSFIRDGEVNETIGFHTTRGDFHSICQFGLDTRRGSATTYFGPGIYLTQDPMKANDYCCNKGDPMALRAMFRVRFLKGKVKEFSPGKFEKFSLEPEGYDSVSGYIARSPEFVLYSNDRVLITHLILYRFSNPEAECRLPNTTVVAGQAKSIIYITPSLANWVNTIEKICSPTQLSQFKFAFTNVIKSISTCDEFMEKCKEIFPTHAIPGDLKSKLDAELQRLHSFRSFTGPSTTPLPPALFSGQTFSLTRSQGVVVSFPEAGLRRSKRRRE